MEKNMDWFKVICFGVFVASVCLIDIFVLHTLPSFVSVISTTAGWLIGELVYRYRRAK